MNQLDQGAKTAGDVISLFTVIGTLTTILPPIAAALTIIWTAIRIYESETVQKMLGKKKGD